MDLTQGQLRGNRSPAMVSADHGTATSLDKTTDACTESVRCVTLTVTCEPESPPPNSSRRECTVLGPAQRTVQAKKIGPRFGDSVTLSLPRSGLVRTNCDLSGCTQTDRSYVGLSRLRGGYAFADSIAAKSSRVQFTRSGKLAATGGIAGKWSGRNGSLRI